MAKGQKRSNREIRKPKQKKPVAVSAATLRELAPSGSTAKKKV